MSLSCADVYCSPYVGEAEGSVRLAFKLARGASPSLLFFDEIDALVYKYDKHKRSVLYITPPLILNGKLLILMRNTVHTLEVYLLPNHYASTFLCV